jgi:hypothetical protein
MLKAPYPYFGGKSKVAAQVWQALGDVDSFIDPFMGSAALLLGRPASHLKRQRREVVNDLDGFIVNFWRAVSHDPDAVAAYADNPRFESDLHARHYWLVQQRSALSEALEGAPEYYDAKIAGWWVWGLSNWIGWGWCSGRGPWRTVDGRLVRAADDEDGVVRRIPSIGSDGGIERKGIVRQLPNTWNNGTGIERSKGIVRQLPHLENTGKGVKRNRIHLSGGFSDTKGIESVTDLQAYMHTLAARLEHVTVTCGDWTRIVQPSVCYSLRDTERTHITGVVLDPPYDQTEREGNIYNHETPVSADVRAWAVANGDNPLMRIVLFGYDGEHAMPDTWRVQAWKSNGGYANPADGRGRDNAHRERIWFSPHCIHEHAAQQLTLFSAAD